MTGNAGVELVTAGVFDGDYVERGGVVLALGGWGDGEAVDFGEGCFVGWI